MTTRRELLETIATATAALLAMEAEAAPSVPMVEITSPEQTFTGLTGVRLVAAPGVTPTAIVLDGCSDVDVSGIAFGARVGVLRGACLEVVNCQRVRIAGNTITGSAAAMVDQVRGIEVSGSSDIEVSGNEVTGVMRGIVLRTSQRIKVIDNHLHHLRSEGINFAQVEDLEIAGNLIHDFAPVGDSATGDHADAIQGWTNGTTEPSRNVLIRDNSIRQGDSPLGMQGIFVRNEEVDTGRAGPEMLYEDIVIEGNLVESSYPHGISVGNVLRLIIRGNTAVQKASTFGQKDPVTGKATAYKLQLRATGSDDAVVENNIANSITITDAAGMIQPVPPSNVRLANTLAAYATTFEGGDVLKPKGAAGARLPGAGGLLY